MFLGFLLFFEVFFSRTFSEDFAQKAVVLLEKNDTKSLTKHKTKSVFSEQVHYHEKPDFEFKSPHIPNFSKPSHGPTRMLLMLYHLAMLQTSVSSFCLKPKNQKAF